MKHYIYRIENPETGQFYIGVRSCKTSIEDDHLYMGSSKHMKALLAEDYSAWRKVIFSTHETRSEAEAREFELTPLEVLKNPLCVNRARGGGGWRLMVPRGPMSDEHKQKLRAAMTGKKLRKLKTTPRKKMDLSESERGRRAATLATWNKEHPRPKKVLTEEEVREATKLRVQKHRAKLRASA